MGVRSVVMGILLAAQLASAGVCLASPSEACLRAAAAAERRWALPRDLLLAIGRVESGRRDFSTGQVQPWPWSANVAGADYVFSSAAEAGAVVGYLRARGVASIDVGCFQVNLHYHPMAFASVAEGFDPEANADYAARFLRSLFERSGSWEAAIGQYHSADPVLGGDYRAKVLRAWRAPEPPGALASIVPPPPAPTGDPYVILAAVAGSAIPVYTPKTLPPALRAALGLFEARGVGKR